MGKRKKTSNEPQKEGPPAQQVVDVTSANPEGSSTMSSDSSENAIQSVAPTNSSISLATDVTASQELSTIILPGAELQPKSPAAMSSSEKSSSVHTEMPPPLHSSQLLQKDPQTTNKTQVNDVTTPKSATKEDLKEEETLSLKPKSPSIAPEVNKPTNEITKSTAKSVVNDHDKAALPAGKITVENKLSLTNESSPPEQNILESISQGNDALTSQVAISVPLQQETETLGTEKNSVSTNLPQTKSSTNENTDSKQPTETKNRQGEKANLSSDICGKEFLMTPQMSTPNPVSPDNSSVNKISQKSDQKCPLSSRVKGEVEIPILKTSYKSAVASTKEKSLQDPKLKNVTESKSQPKQSTADKVDFSIESLDMQKPSTPKEKIQPQTSLEKKDDTNKLSHPTGNKIDTGIDQDSRNSVFHIENTTLPTESVHTPVSSKNDTEIKNIVYKNDDSKLQNEKSIGSTVPPQNQTAPDKTVTTVSVAENKTPSSSVPIQKKTDTEIEVSTTGHETLSKASTSPPVAGKAPEKEFNLEITSKCLSKDSAKPNKSNISSTSVTENAKNAPISETGNAQTPAAQILKAEKTSVETHIENKPGAKVEKLPQSETLSKEGNVIDFSVASEFPFKTTESEGAKEAIKKDGMKNETSKSRDKEGNNSEQKSDEKNNTTEKIEIKSNRETISTAPERNPTKKSNRKEVQSPKKVVSEPAKKLNDPTSTKLGTSIPVTDVIVDDNVKHDSKEKENSVTNAQDCNTSKSIKETDCHKAVKMQGATKKGQRQVVGEVKGTEVKTIETNNKTKAKKPETKDVVVTTSESSKTVVEETSVKSNSETVSENKQEKNSVSKKSKSKKSKQKVTNAHTLNISGSEDTESNISKGGDNKEINKSTPESNSKEKSSLLGLMQEVINVIGKNNESREQSDTVQKDGENEIKKPNKSKNRKKSKPKESNETQEKDSSVKTQEDPVKLAKADINTTTQKLDSKIHDNENKSTDFQEIKPETVSGLSENIGKITAKSKKGKRNAGKNKEDSKQSSDKSKQISARSKTQQPSTSELTSISTRLDELTGEGEALIDDIKDGQTVQENSQPKKKKKHRKNKSKPCDIEEDNKIGKDEENNETTPAPEAVAGIKKNSNRIKLTEKIGTCSIDEINKNTQIKTLKVEVKPEEIKPQKVSEKFSEEQLNHLTRTAVNLSQSLGDSDSFNLKITPDVMRSLLTPKPKDIFSSPEDDEEIEYRMVQRQIFLSYVCHVCKSIESKTCSLKKCNNCKLISYCSKKHQKDHWSAHKDMCTAITNICKREGLTHLFQNALGLVPNDYRLYRTHYANLCAQELGRELQLWEKEMIYYPQVCHMCYNCETQNLKTCHNCSHVGYCSENHRRTDHDIWCKEFQIYRDITLHQFHNGMIRPILPERVFDENVPVTGNMESFLSKAYNITEKSVQMSKLHFVSLTDVATCPFTVLYSLQNIEFPLKDANSLTVHLVGAEMFFEIDCIRKWEILLLHLLSSIKMMKIVFVGPELSVDSAIIKSLSETKVCQSCSFSGRKVVYEFWPGLYHDFMRSEMYGKPDLICAFNSGLYRPVDFGGMDTWSPTIEAIFKNVSIPVVVTEYTEEELPLDIARIQTISSSVDIVISPTRNLFSSMKPSLNFLSEEKVPVIFKNFYISIIKSRVQ